MVPGGSQLSGTLPATRVPVSVTVPPWLAMPPPAAAVLSSTRLPVMASAPKLTTPPPNPPVRRGVTPCAMRPAVTGASEREGARAGDRVAFVRGQQVQGAAAVRVALRHAGAIDPAGAGAARPGEDAGAAGELRAVGDGEGQAARVRVEADDLEVLDEAEQVQGALREDQVVAVHVLRVTGLRRQFDDLAGAVEGAAGSDVAGELDALAGHTGHFEEPGEALRSGRQRGRR